MIQEILLEAARRPRIASRLHSVAGLDEATHQMHALCAATSGGPVEEIVGRIAQEHLGSGGKQVRARLALSAADALGVEARAAIPWAAAVELLHNATLVHDDLQDGDVLRRGMPTTWAKHGAAQAINCGDLLLLLPVMAIDAIDVDDGVRFRLSRSLHQRAVATVRGQGADLALRQTLEASTNPVDAYQRCIEGKTGELFALPVEGASLLAGMSAEEARAVAEPFFALGLLFQLQDDVLDLFGDKGREARGSDIKEGKISALVVEHLRLHPTERSWLLAILDASREHTSNEDVQDVIRRFESGGALDAVLRRIALLATRAHNSPALRKHPALRALVLDVIGLVLSPIHDCFLRPEAGIQAPTN